MENTKNDQIRELALELLGDAEMSRTSVEALVLKASRLARLLDDDEVTGWLSYEIHGYNDSEALSHKYLGLTNRWIDVDQKKACFAPIAVHEGSLDTYAHQLEIIKQFHPSGDWAALHFQGQQDKAIATTNNILMTRRILSAVRALVQRFATRVYYEMLFSKQAESIFAQYQHEVDALLAAKAEKAFARLPQAFQRLAAGDEEAVSHALTTCRRVIDGVADALYPPSDEPAKIGEQPLAVGEQHTRNRLRAYVYDRIGKGSRYERMNKTIGSLYDRVSAGVHADVAVGEARALVLQTYLLLGEILSFDAPA